MEAHSLTVEELVYAAIAILAGVWLRLILWWEKR
jgi:hypothetical protein